MILRFRLPAALAVSAALTGAGQMAHADVALPHLISDGMVIEQKTPVRIYGTAAAGEKVTVTLLKQQTSTVTDATGHWSVMLKPVNAGGPYDLTIAGKNTITVKDVLVGEVWVCSGQSNMEMNFGWGVENGTETVASSADPQLRMFTVTKSPQTDPQYDVAGGKWEPASPTTTGNFSVVGYYFARSLRKALGVPIGMIHTSWGGTPIEAWTSKANLLATGLTPDAFDALNISPDVVAKRAAAHDKALAAWQAAGSPTDRFADPGIADTAKNWFDPNLDQSGWHPIITPGNWESKGIDELAYLDGAVWLRKEITLPESWNHKSATLSLGAIDDVDVTWVNGTWVGATDSTTPQSWTTLRNYQVPVGVLRAGRNVIAVRVWDETGGGGMTGPVDKMLLTLRDGSAAPLPLNGEWRYKIENGRPSDPGPLNQGINPNTASSLYNGMLYPVTKYTIKGAIWYQGEANAWKGSHYETRMPSMIRNWRADWGIGDFPFFMVELAPYVADAADGDSWAWLRETQFHTTQVLPRVGLAVIDTESGMLKDIHPKRKQPVGERLSLLAQQVAYGAKVEGISPTYRGMNVANGSAVLRFDHVGAGLEGRPVKGEDGVTSDGSSIVGFTVAGADGVFHPATATISGKDTVTVTATTVPRPVVVRYGWANYPVMNLWSKDGLPAIPFRTDPGSDK